MRHSICLPAMLIVAFAASLGSQQQPPSFRGGIALVTMDVTALGSDGWPVRDLRADELTLTVNGRERPIKSFESIEVAPRAIAGTKPASETTPAAASNVAPPGRNVFFVILHDHISQGNERQPIQGAMTFIDRLEQRDRVAVITMPFGRVEVDLTTDHARAKTRLSHIVGHSQSATGNETTSEWAALLEFVKGLAALNGPKTIVLISEGLNATGSGLFSPGDIPTRPETMSAGDSDMNGVSSRQGVFSFPGEIGGLRGAAAAARAQFYVIQPNMMSGAAFRMPKTANDAINNRTDQRSNQTLDEQLVDQTSALASVASVTGGQFFQLSARATGVYDRILRESSAYYAIAFEADADDLAGKESKITVKTSRHGITIRARRTLLETAAGKPALTLSAHDMAASAAPFGDLTLSAVAYATRGVNGGIKALVVADSVERSWKEAAFTLVDSKGKIAAAWPADIPAGGPLITAQVVKSGHYRLRAAAVDAVGRGGAVDYEFEAELQKAGPVTFASLMVGTVNGGAFRPRLFFEPATEVTPYLEIYGTVPVSVTFALTKAGDETPLITATGELTSTRDPDRHIATASLPLTGLAAGEFTMRAAVSVAGQRVGGGATVLHVVVK